MLRYAPFDLDRGVRVRVHAPVREQTERRAQRLHGKATRVGDKFLCVVVRIKGEDAFLLTAYLTDKMKRGVKLWPSEK